MTLFMRLLNVVFGSDLTFLNLLNSIDSGMASTVLITKDAGTLFRTNGWPHHGSVPWRSPLASVKNWRES